MRGPLLLLLFCAPALLAHDIWLGVQPAAPAPDAEAELVVAGGHYFPASEMVLQDRLVHSLHVQRPDGRQEELKTAPSGLQREGRFALSGIGWHVVTLVVQKPQLAQPDYWARALVIPEGAADQSYPASGAGLEIVPAGALPPLRVGQELQLETRINGAAADGKIQLVAAAGGTDWLAAKPGRPAKLSLRKPGRYLLIFTKGSQSCSLTFHVASS